MQSERHITSDTANLTLMANATQLFLGNASAVSATKNYPLNWAAFALIPVILLVATGNVLVIMAVFLDRKLRSATNCFLTSLAVADLLVALTVMPPSLAMISKRLRCYKQQLRTGEFQFLAAIFFVKRDYIWPFSDEMCELWVTLDVFFSTSSILHLCMISLDRCLALSRPLRNRSSVPTPTNWIGRYYTTSYHRSKTIKKVGSRIALVWLLALGIAIPILIKGKQNRSNLFVDRMCAINLPEFAIYGSLVAFFLPLIVMFVAYTFTIRTLTQQAQMISTMIVHSGRNSPVCTSRRSPISRRCNKQSFNEETNKYTTIDYQLQRQETGPSEDETSVTAENLRSMLLTRQMSDKLMTLGDDCKCSGEEEAEQSTWRKKAGLPFVKALKQMQSVIGIRQQPVDVKTERKSVLKTMKKKGCTCTKSHMQYNEEQKFGKNNKSFTKYYRSPFGSISKSFKNRAMASITTEQRASKILGFVFGLFCLFWCPFFITNVISQLCTTCNKEAIGQCMNWFVWVGYVSSGVNPCVYTLFSARFRNTFLKLLRGKWAELKQEKRTRSYSGRDNFSEGSLRSIAYSDRRASSKTSIRMAPTHFKTNLLSENTSGTSMSNGKLKKITIQDDLKNLHTTNTDRSKCWRSRWHTASLQTSASVSRKTCRIQSNLKDQLHCLHHKSLTENKRSNLADETRWKPCYKSHVMSAPASPAIISKAGEVVQFGFQTPYTHLLEKEDASDTNLSSLDGETFSEKVYVAKTCCSVNINSKESKENNLKQKHFQITRVHKNIITSNTSAPKTIFTTNKHQGISKDEYLGNSTSCPILNSQEKNQQPSPKTKLTNSCNYKREILTRKDSGMGLSLDHFPSITTTL